MENILVLGLNNSVSPVLIEKNSVNKEFDLFFTQSKSKELSKDDHIFYFNFLDDYDIDNKLLRPDILAIFSKVIVISSYYGESSEGLTMNENLIMNKYLINLENLILTYIESREREARIIFLGSIAGEDQRKSRYPLYKHFKLGLRSFNSMINLYYNNNSISSTYINLGSFSSDASLDNISKINSNEVVDLIIYLLKLPFTLKVSDIDFKPLSE